MHTGDLRFSWQCKFTVVFWFLSLPAVVESFRIICSYNPEDHIVIHSVLP